ncbi:MAG: PucR family transcriptional regulator [Clostridiales bacterium]|nr:PucR family transcriptional regulator [Clostridiales bacterium]
MEEKDLNSDLNLSLDQYKSRLLEALVSNDGIQKIIDIGFELAGNPIMLIDAGFKMLAYTHNVEVEDPNWYLHQQSDFISSELIADNEMKDNFAQASKSDHPVLINSKRKGFEVIHTAVFIDGKVVAYLVIPDHMKKLDETDLEKAQLLKSVIALELQKNSFYRNSRGMMNKSLIADLIEGNIRDERVIEARCQSLGWIWYRNLHVLTLQRINSRDDQTPLDRVGDVIQSTIEGSKVAVFRNVIAVIISRKKKDFPQTDLSKLKDLLQKHGLFGGISNCYYSLADTSEQFTLSLAAIELGVRIDPGKLLYQYQDYTMYHLISIAAKQFNLEKVCHPALLSLIEYDETFGEDLSNCLYEYLRNNRNQVKAANTLGIHRNTMSYRLKRISELMGLDLEDESTAFNLLYSIRIKQYMELFKDHQTP